MANKGKRADPVFVRKVPLFLQQHAHLLQVNKKNYSRSGEHEDEEEDDDDKHYGVLESELTELHQGRRLSDPFSFKKSPEAKAKADADADADADAKVKVIVADADADANEPVGSSKIVFRSKKTKAKSEEPDDRVSEKKKQKKRAALSFDVDNDG